MNKILVIQTAFIGDVVLATAVLEKLHQFYPQAKIDFLIRKGNEGLVSGHPFIHSLLVWDKKKDKYKHLLQITKQVRGAKYDAVVNLQRFAASGLVTALSGSKIKLGFDKNPFSFTYSGKSKHEIGNGLHEVERNQKVISSITTNTKALPRLYPSDADFERTKTYKTGDYVVLAPASVWYTKQVPVHKWIELINALNSDLSVFLIGAPGDHEYCESIVQGSRKNRVKSLAGKLSFLESAALMKDAKMNYVNDSAPLHIAGAVKAPVTAFFCSTVPEFGFGPFQNNGQIAQTEEKLDCRPCGLHGLKSCPKEHFNCSETLLMNKYAV
ncbi:MAG: heptosyltransferase [Crocinitomicaceae bacterium]|nr:heptosyltransferase [Crocinitomicaceae bacterium]